MKDRELKPLEAELVKLKSEHLFRCLVQGCYYGSGDICKFCYVPRPSDVVVGQSPIQSIRNLIVAFAVCVLVAGCGAKTVPPPQIIREVQTVEVKVPVQVQRTPPAELLAPLQPPLPVFVEPSNPEASSALTAEGERLLRGMIEELLTRITAWKTWAETTDK